MDKFEALWTIAPGIGTGGSKGGTKELTEVNAAPIKADPPEYHLYASPEEILFQQDLRGGKRLIHEQITPEKLEYAKFFLTARSRAPETTLLGYPRMSMWPMSSEVGNRTAFDKAIAFCSTIGGPAQKNKKPYFFQREDAYSRHNEFYGNAAGQNNVLYEAYQHLLNEPIPGFGASFGQKYGQGKFDDRNNILAETLDYFRGTNLYDPSNPKSQYTNGGNSKKFDKQVGHGQIAAICLCGGSSDHTQRWFNSRLPLPKGFGRMIGLSEFALILVQRAEWKAPDPNNPDDKGAFIGDTSDQTKAWANGGKMAVGTQLIQMGVLVEGFAPAHGWTSLQPQNTITIGGGVGNTDADLPKIFTLAGFQLKRGKAEGQEFSKAATSTTKRPKDWIAWGGYGGVRMFKTIMSFEPVVIQNSEKTLKFGGSTDRDPVRVILYDNVNGSGNLDTGNLIQSYQLAFPPVELPVPSFNREKGNKFYSFKNRMAAAINDGVDKLFSPTADVIRSLVPSHGDYRLLTSKRVVEAASFIPHPDYFEKGMNMAHSLTDYTSSADNGVRLLSGGKFEGKFLGLEYPDGSQPDFPIDIANDDYAKDVKRDAEERKPYTPDDTGDFDNGVGNAPDGAYINRPDDGDSRGLGGSGDPYFDNNRDPRERAASTFSPNRVIPSAGILGSLSTGVQTNVPWQTLLFRPMPPEKHYGARVLPDHLWMDYFWMPIVQPYVISEPFSTAGKVNMNYQILPFDYITRATGMHAVMKAEKILAIPNTAVDSYKSGSNDEWRKFIDIGETLKQWEEKFKDGDAFRSATEICDMYLVPEGEQWRSAKGMQSFWERHKLTGDNTKERPYTNIYPRLTVRSNTFKVHLVAQSIVKVKGTDPATFDSRRDKIGGEYRGSAVVERAIAPADKDIPDYALRLSKSETPEPLDNFYTYRIINEKRFAP
ncbi:MAG: Verru_Chthon cassette protein A [Verrucomicrobia bacterium]|nr:Verru_Chthon cassette protein A [Verrucomicrobiota bacterium]